MVLRNRAERCHDSLLVPPTIQEETSQRVEAIEPSFAPGFAFDDKPVVIPIDEQITPHRRYGLVNIYGSDVDISMRQPSRQVEDAVVVRIESIYRAERLSSRGN